MLRNQDDIIEIARWAVRAFGQDAVMVIRRRAAENLLAEEEEAAQTWRLVADAAQDFLCGRNLH